MRSAWWEGDYPITQGYGCTDFTGEPFNPRHPECPHWHDGIDIGIPCGRSIIAPNAGTVAQVGVYGGGPNALILAVGGWWIWLLHLQANWVNIGDQFGLGQILGEVGTLGFSTGCHLHFQVTPAGSGYFDSVDPSAWLISGGARGCAIAPLLPLVGLAELLMKGVGHVT